jgi:hypothetical protein
MSTNPFPHTPANVTYEQVMEMFQENNRLVKELVEDSANLKKVVAEYIEQSKETTKAVKEMNIKSGELQNRFGELAEHLVAPGIARCFNELGYDFNYYATDGVEIKDAHTKQAIAEIDLLYEDSEAIALVEVKAKPKIEDIEKHIKRIHLYCRHRKKLIKDKRKVIGAIAGAIFPSEVRNATLQAGLFVITQSDDTVKIDIPENFKPHIF